MWNFVQFHESASSCDHNLMNDCPCNRWISRVRACHGLFLTERGRKHPSLRYLGGLKGHIDRDALMGQPFNDMTTQSTLFMWLSPLPRTGSWPKVQYRSLGSLYACTGSVTIYVSGTQAVQDEHIPMDTGTCRAVMAMVPLPGNE